MSDSDAASLTVNQRLTTFQGLWEDEWPTALQLAAIGHVSDRPPLESLQEGSRCISCAAFAPKADSIQALQGSVINSHSYTSNLRKLSFHHPGCLHHQVRMPLDPQAIIPGLHGGLRVHQLRQNWESRLQPPSTLPSTNPSQKPNPTPPSHPLFTLPPELRLQIYTYLLPSLPPFNEIVQRNRDSALPTTLTAQTKTGPLDTTHTNLLATCRLIHAEALPLLYSQTTHQFNSTKVLYLFLRHIGSAGRSELQHVDVVCGHREDAIAFALLGACERLRSVVVRLKRPKLLSERAPLWMVDGVTCLLALRGLERVEFASGREGGVGWLSEGMGDAEVLRRELTRSKGEASGVREIGGGLDV
ncbi:hypothetical protein MBLNU230_g5615t1 [Neophaeotheca triangularis]